MKKTFYKKILPAVLSVCMVLTVCIPYGISETAYGEEANNNGPVVNESEGLATPDADNQGVPDADDQDVPDADDQDVSDSEDPVVPDPEGPVVPDPEGPDVPDTKININKATVTLANAEFKYTGKAIHPAVKVMYEGVACKQGVDYKVRYENCVKPGTATAVVQGIGKMTGTKNLKYTINLPKAKILKVTTPGYRMNKIYWQKVSGVTGYSISRATSRYGEYKNLAYLNNSYSAWTDKNANVPQVYYYRVRTFKDIDGKRYFSPKQIGYAMKTRLTATNKVRANSVNYNTVDVNWNKVEGATGYMVYRSVGNNSKYSRIATLKGNSTTHYRNTKLVTGKKYYYKIVAYKNNINNPGLMSNYYYATPKLQGAHWNKKGLRKYEHSVRLCWQQVPGATGYEIYKYSRSKGQYVLRARVGMDYRVFTDKNLDKTGRYSYKVRACRKINGVRYHGGFTSVYKKFPTGWVEKNGLKLYYNKNGYLVKDLRVMLGHRSSYWLKVNKQMNVVTAYAMDGSGRYNIPVVSFICSSGNPTPIGTFYTPAKYRWHELMGPSWGQWNTRIHEGFLFHSVYYLEKNDNKSLPPSVYNRLGQTESHGCVRLRAGDAKWIYDNCSLGTKVTIYKSSNPGPYGKPKLEKLPSWHTWDPTDPTAFKYCKAHHCHGK